MNDNQSFQNQSLLDKGNSSTSKQQQQQQLQLQFQNMKTNSSAFMGYSGLISAPDARHSDFLDPPDLFGFGAMEFDMAGKLMTNGGFETVMSPLSSATIETNALDQNLRPSGPSSLNSSPYGTPLSSMPSQVQQGFKYSVSVPVHTNSVLQGGGASYSFNSPAIKEEEATVGGVRQVATLLDEKRRKRRESHNAVERRRRDHMNEMIQELSNMMPEYPEDSKTKPHKGVILKRSVDYIRNLQTYAGQQAQRTHELENVLGLLMQQYGISEASLGLSFALGTNITLQTNPSSSTSELFETADDEL